MTDVIQNDGNVTGKVILLTRSPIWSAAVRRLSLPCGLIHAVDIDDLLAESEANRGSLGLVELTEQKIGPTCRSIAKIANHFSHLRLVALAYPDLASWAPLVRSAGFADVFWSTIDSNRLLRLIEAHLWSIDWPIQSLEQQFEARLPWPPTRTRAVSQIQESRTN